MADLSKARAEAERSYTLIPAPNARSSFPIERRSCRRGLSRQKARAQEVDFAGGFALMFSSYLVLRPHRS